MGYDGVDMTPGMVETSHMTTYECPKCHTVMSELEQAGVTAEIGYTDGGEVAHAECLEAA